MSEEPWVAPGSAPPPEQVPPPSSTQPGPYTAPPPGYAAPPPGYAAPPPGYAAPPPGYAAPPPGYGAPPPGYGPPVGYLPPPPGPSRVAGLEFRPGIIPLRPLTLGDLYGAVTKAIRGNVAATIGLAVLTSLVCLVPTTALGAWVASRETLSVDSVDSVESGTFGLYGIVGNYLPAIGSFFATIALTGFLAYVIGQAVLGRKVGIGETWDGTKRRLPALVGAVLLTFLGALLLVVLLFGLPVGWLVAAGDAQPVPIVLLVLAAIALVPISLFLWTRLAFVTAVIVLEERGVFSAFARSWQLTSGTPFWRILGIRILTSVAVAVAAYLITLPLTIAGFALVFSLGDEGDLFMWQAILGGVASLISGAITTPFSAGVDALLAIDQRIRREGLDVQLIHASQQGGPAPWPSAAGAR
jgi:hypothetical protein